MCSPSSSPAAPQINETSVNPGASFKVNPTICPLLTACRWACPWGPGLPGGMVQPQEDGWMWQHLDPSHHPLLLGLLQQPPAWSSCTQPCHPTVYSHNSQCVLYLSLLFWKPCNSFPLAFRVIAKAFAMFYKVLHDLAPQCLSDLIYCSVLLPWTLQLYFCYRFMLFTVSEMFLQISTAGFFMVFTQISPHQ